MAKTVNRYLYDDLKNSNNSCIFSTIVQLSKQCGIPYSTLQKIFKEGDIYYDRDGRFKLEKRLHYIAESKIRRK